MSWRKIAEHAFALFATQLAVGFFERVFASADSSTTLVGHIVSFILGGSIFAYQSANKTFKPFAHAWVALAFQIAAAFVLWQALAGWLGSTPIALVALEWSVLISALLVGTSVGSFLRRSTG